MHIGIVAGEISGNLLGEGLIASLKQFQPQITCSGMGGKEMIAQGFESLFSMERLSVMGIIEPLKRLPEIYKMRQHLYRHFIAKKPDIFVGIDSPDFNLGLENKLRKAGIPTVHYVSPSVWAWRQKRIYKIAKATDLVLTLFPFELDFYNQHHVPAVCVGHPLADKIPFENSTQAARQRLGLGNDETIIALLPGSRRNELHYLADIFLQTATACLHEKKSLTFITASATAQLNEEFKKRCHQIAPHLPIHYYLQKSHDVMQAADIILVTSGTATLEAALFKKPMIIAYKMANLTYHIAKHLVKIPYIGLPNLLANKKLVPEFIQDEVTPNNLSSAILDFLSDENKIENLKKEFLSLHQLLCRNANDLAAKSVLSLLK